MKIKNFCKENKISKSTVFKYFDNMLSNQALYKIKKMGINLDNLEFEDYQKEYQKWFISYVGKNEDLRNMSKKAHISIPSLIKYIKGWKLNKQIAKKIDVYLSENKLNISIENYIVYIDKDKDLNEKEYHGKNYTIYSWDIDKDKRRIQIEIIDDHVLIKKKKDLLSLIENYIIKIFAWIYKYNEYGIIVDINKENEEKIVDIIDKKYI